MDPRYTVTLDRTMGRWVYPLHRHLYQLTDGRVGHRSWLGPILLLTATGRKTGQPRVTPLLYMPDGPDFVVVGSNAGRPGPPQWLLNLEADPEAGVQAGRRRVPVLAQVLRGDDAAELWPRLDRHYPGWSYYQQLTDRPILPVRLVDVS
jgi:F420H(2)-dependent quinone reductase